MVAAGEHIRVLLPPDALRPVVICGIVRGVQLAGAAVHRSRVHANPYGSINLLCHGTVRPCGGEPLPAAFLTGPMSRPLETQVESDLHSISVIVQPWSLGPLTGAAIAELVDRVVPLPARHLGSAREAACSLERMRRADDPGVEELWSALGRLLHRALEATPPRLALTTLRTDGVGAAARACAVSERQYRRRFVATMGLGPAAWVRVARLESVIAGMVSTSDALGDLAAATGYSDQAHLSRDARDLLGHSPKSLQHGLQDGAVDWPLRAARPIFSRPGVDPDLPSGDELP